ncbi:hypothetical protein PYW08_002830 [Mythimna loreyi]|uniref:Uncharacterized protein n=1 Tax=Mythimna loreyi TaxID=667449 RepID=A0ACC2QK08_9NEOP|nr:hypothetical protein PYW08_002830 [Mythimna loreyi]
MKRIQMCNKVDATNSSLNYVNRKHPLSNAVSPEILVGQIWLQDEVTPVEIIELNTSDEIDPSANESLGNRLSHAWSFTNNEKLQQIEDSYRINKKARERRRLNHENQFRTTNTATNTNNRYLNNNFYPDIVENQFIDDRQLINHQVNCFTMLNKNFTNSDSSSEADIEVLNSDDLPMDNNWEASKHSYEEEIITYDPELDKETRTVWIYSFKNKHLLDDYELTDAVTRDMSFSSTSSSTEGYDEKVRDKSTNMRRLGSPIPPTYIPRLNLTLGPTLSTVSEVSEPNKQTSPSLSHKSPRPRFQKHKNSWVMAETEKLDTSRSGRKIEKSTNVVNWMGLSPREKRRSSKQQSDKWVGELLKLETLPIKESNQQQTEDDSGQDNNLRLKVDVDVHVNEKTPEKRSVGTPNSANTIMKPNTDKICSIDLLKRPPLDVQSDELDRGDHTPFAQTQQVLCFSGPSHIYETIDFNDHVHMRVIGKLTVIEERAIEVDPVRWEREQNIEVETANYDYLTDQLKIAKKDPDQTWLKNNAPLLVPSSWQDYAAAAEPPLTIEMSNPNVATSRTPWYKRFFKTLNCFK